jgi:hypothetical protein
LKDLNILLWLSSRVEPDWINTMTIVHPTEKMGSSASCHSNRRSLVFIFPISFADVVIGVSVSGMIKLWSLNDLDKRDPGHVIYEDESKIMSSQK